MATVLSGWASYSYKTDPNDPKRVLYTPDAVFQGGDGAKEEADRFGAYRSSGRTGFPHPVRYVVHGGAAYVLPDEAAAIGLDRYGFRVEHDGGEETVAGGW